jgi:DNA-directed RNA polymerase subunit N
MIIPVRCFTCGKVIGHLWAEYQKKIEAGEEPAKAMDSLGITRYCCRTTFLTHSDNIKEIARFKV